ncbi:MAG: 16S rRNA (guanine(527)-N(7))-methyltransferase RsmG [Clostridiales bacterium]|jgi:16S rRNA (guanine527-N7)-methyltransferase|nr:16S rRNA (guanine(527)-N(7))-methyltransferase RsmG [Clostridiales bacterium]
MKNEYDSDFDLLREAEELLGLTFDKKDLNAFKLFYEEVTTFNNSVNLTTITEKKDFAVKHIADSLTAAKYIPIGASVCDIGPGGGFPSIPLKIMRSDLSFRLFEASAKKTTFINSAASLLGLESFNCLHMRAEDAGRGKFRESFDVAVARAVAPLNTLLEYALPLVKPGGIFIAYKAHAQEELSVSERAAVLLGAGIPQAVDLILPFTDVKRTLLIYKKINNTPVIYPRGGNKERSSPI